MTEREKNPYSNYGDIKLSLALNSKEEAKDVCSLVVGLSTVLSTMVELGDKLLQLKDWQFDPTAKKWLRIFGWGVTGVGLMGRSFFDRQANLVADEISRRFNNGNSFWQDRYAKTILEKVSTNPAIPKSLEDWAKAYKEGKVR